MAGYKNMDSYVEKMAEKYGSFSNDSGSSISADSEARNYIAQQLQRLQDNGFDLGDGAGFMDKAGGLGSSGFNDKAWYKNFDFLNLLGEGDDSSSLGNTEVEAIAYTMMQLDELQSSGRISAEDYAGYMAKLVSPESIDGIEAHGGNAYMNLLEDIDRLGDKEPSIGVAAENAEKMSVEARAYINDKNDYVNSALEANPNRAYQSKDGHNIYDEMSDILADAHDKGLLDDDQYDAARNGLRDYENGNGTKTEKAMLYAMQDALALGDPEMAAKIMSKDGFNMIGKDYPSGTAGTAISAAGVQMLQELEQKTHIAGIYKPETGIGNESPAPVDPPFIPTPVISDDRVEADIDAEKLQEITDRMAANYFEKQGEDGITAEEYGELKDAYDKIAEEDPEHAAERQKAFKQAYPEFAAADSYMQQLDTLQESVESGRVTIVVNGTDKEGNETYGIRYNESQDQKLDEFIKNAPFRLMQEGGNSIMFKDAATVLKDADAQDKLVDAKTDPQTIAEMQELIANGAADGLKLTAENMIYYPQLDPQVAYYPILDPQVTYYPQIVPQPDNTFKLPIHFSDSFMDDFNQAADEVEAEIEIGNKEPYDDTDKDHDDEDSKANEDYDAELAENDLELMNEQSPIDKFESMRSAAEAAWNGELGNGSDRIAALEAMGFDEEDRTRIQEMVNLGSEWCRSATAEDYDKEFPSEDGRTLAEQDAEFKAAQAEAASRLMTYEGYEDLMEQYNAGVAEGEGITEDEAREIYDKAAHALDEAYAEGRAPEGASEAEVAESTGNLVAYVAENPDAGFATDAPIVVHDEALGGECDFPEETQEVVEDDEYDGVPG